MSLFDRGGSQYRTLVLTALKHPIAVSAALIIGMSVPASADPAATIIQPPNTKAAATAPLTYGVINASRLSIMLSTSGGCGFFQRPMKPAAHLYASCAVADGNSTIAATTYPAMQQICAAHVTRQNGINAITFEGSTTCRELQSLNHIEITVASPALH
jgi:hypothetical protein